MSISPVNLILYGPPGTGKTYSTAAEAVRLCGEAVPEDRAELMTAYKRLLEAGRIEFVTFHQSMSYEEFVEGLRPETPSAEVQESDTDEPDTAGFRLKVEDGIFKRICERARLDGEGSADHRLDRERSIFRFAALVGRPHREEGQLVGPVKKRASAAQRSREEKKIKEALDANEIRHGWGGENDWSDKRFENRDEIKAVLERQRGKEVIDRVKVVGISHSFRSKMKVGDYVVIPKGSDRMRAFGKITSNYFYEADAEHQPHPPEYINAEHQPHRRKMKWLWRDDRGTERARFYPNGFSGHDVCKMKRDLVNWDVLQEIVSARPHVLIIDEINRANISRVFGELITLLEPDKRLRAENEIRLTLPYSREPFGVPSNLHILGTMNTADRSSIALLDTALGRRFTFHEMMPDA